MTPFELGRLLVEKRAEKPLPSQDYQTVPPNIDDDTKAIIEAFRRASLKSMGLRANTKVKIDTEPEEFIISAHPLFGTKVKPILKEEAMTPFELGRLTVQKQAGLPIVYTLREIASRLMGRGGVAYEAKMKKKKEREEAKKMQESNKIENPIEEVKTAFELGALTVKKAAKKPGLWDNIHAKRERGEAPAKPGDKDYPDQKSWNATVKASGDAWQRAEGKNPEGGLNAKGRASLKAEGQDIKPPVTEDKPTGERAGRKASFCARMGGMKKKLTSSETANDPDSRINKALRKWNC